MKNLVLAAALAVSLPTISIADTIQIQSSALAGSWEYEFYGEWSQKFNDLTGPDGAKIEILPFNAVVPFAEVMDATVAGLLGGDMNAVAYYTGREPAFALLGDLIGAYNTPDQATVFCHHGGGKELLQKAYDQVQPNQLVVVGCGAFSSEGLVINKPVHGPQDLAGMKLRAPAGIAGELFTRFGAAPVSIPWGEIADAIDKGTIDGADASSYSTNSGQGFHKASGHALYPGVHSMAVIQLTLSKAAYDSLSNTEKTLLDMWYWGLMSDMTNLSELRDKEAVAKDLKDGIVVIDWSAEARTELREMAAKIWPDFGAQSPLAQEVLDAQMAYLKQLGLL